jgi:hypothetical protein
MLKLIPDYGVKIVEDTPEVERLAGLYLAGEAVPVGFYTDALHIAITAVYGLDFSEPELSAYCPGKDYQDYRGNKRPGRLPGNRDL